MMMKTIGTRVKKWLLLSRDEAASRAEKGEHPFYLFPNVKPYGDHILRMSQQEWENDKFNIPMLWRQHDRKFRVNESELRPTEECDKSGITPMSFWEKTLIELFLWIMESDPSVGGMICLLGQADPPGRKHGDPRTIEQQKLDRFIIDDFFGCGDESEIPTSEPFGPRLDELDFKEIRSRVTGSNKKRQEVKEQLNELIGATSGASSASSVYSETQRGPPLLPSPPPSMPVTPRTDSGNEPTEQFLSPQMSDFAPLLRDLHIIRNNLVQKFGCREKPGDKGGERILEFIDIGTPTKSDEYWHCTNLTALEGIVNNGGILIPGPRGTPEPGNAVRGKECVVFATETISHARTSYGGPCAYTIFGEDTRTVFIRVALRLRPVGDETPRRSNNPKSKYWQATKFQLTEAWIDLMPPHIRQIDVCQQPERFDWEGYLRAQRDTAANAWKTAQRFAAARVTVAVAAMSNENLTPAEIRDTMASRDIRSILERNLKLEQDNRVVQEVPESYGAAVGDPDLDSGDEFFQQAWISISQMTLDQNDDRTWCWCNVCRIHTASSTFSYCPSCQRRLRRGRKGPLRYSCVRCLHEQDISDPYQCEQCGATAQTKVGSFVQFPGSHRTITNKIDSQAERNTGASSSGLEALTRAAIVVATSDTRLSNIDTPGASSSGRLVTPGVTGVDLEESPTDDLEPSADYDREDSDEAELQSVTEDTVMGETCARCGDITHVTADCPNHPIAAPVVPDPTQYKGKGATMPQDKGKGKGKSKGKGKYKGKSQAPDGPDQHWPNYRRRGGGRGGGGGGGGITRAAMWGSTTAASWRTTQSMTTDYPVALVTDHATTSELLYNNVVWPIMRMMLNEDDDPTTTTNYVRVAFILFFWLVFLIGLFSIYNRVHSFFSRISYSRQSPEVTPLEEPTLVDAEAQTGPYNVALGATLEKERRTTAGLRETLHAERTKAAERIRVLEYNLDGLREDITARMTRMWYTRVDRRRMSAFRAPNGVVLHVRPDCTHLNHSETYELVIDSELRHRVPWCTRCLPGGGFPAFIPRRSLEMPGIVRQDANMVGPYEAKYDEA